MALDEIKGRKSRILGGGTAEAVVDLVRDDERAHAFVEPFVELLAPGAEVVLTIDRGVGLEGRTPQDPRVNLPGDKPSITGRAQKVAVVHHDLAAQDDGRRPALNLPALPGAIVPQV